MLDRLRAQNGQTLSGLCESVAMARQSLTQHLDVLAEAQLITVARRGRERLHFLNPVPIQEIGERWIAAYEADRLAALGAIKHRAEEIAMAEVTVPDYLYVTYIRATPDQVWQALTDADLTARYWGHANVSDWQVGSRWEHRQVDESGVVDVAGTVLVADPPRSLTMTFESSSGEGRPNGSSEVAFVIEPEDGYVRLTVTHSKLPNTEMLQGISNGWPAVLANLKSMLETGDVLWSTPWVKS